MRSGSLWYEGLGSCASTPRARRYAGRSALPAPPENRPSARNAAFSTAARRLRGGSRHTADRGLISVNHGVPSIRSRAADDEHRPLRVCAALLKRHGRQPMGLGRNGDRVANTPCARCHPASAGAPSATKHPARRRKAPEQPYRCEVPRTPRKRPGFDRGFSNTISRDAFRHDAAWRGMPNFPGKSSGFGR